MEDKFTIMCKKCGGKAEMTLEDDSACGDPECCGDRSSWVAINCKNCDNRYKSDSF
jgi:hypothetical protein